MIGQTLGHYRIVEKIGEGGMGVVYRAHDERLDRDVALKILPAGMLANRAAVKSFREEAQALSRLNHPNIATIHDFDAQDGLSFLVMEYVQGSTLSKKVAAGPLPEKEVIRLGTQLSQGLQAAHTSGVIHRDLKPSNLAVTADCHLKILDFGLARLSAHSDPEATQTGAEIGPQAGTLPYMAPEQLDGQPADERSDIYAAGAVLYEMSTGQRLFPDKHGTRLMDAICHCPVRPPRDLNNQISRDLQDIIQKAIDKDPDRRYQSAKELKVDLQRLPLVPKAYEPGTDQDPNEASLEIAHVLYMDIVEYSKSPMDQQKRLTEDLQNSVRATSEFSRAKSRKNLISLPTGDGMALVFFNDPESPCRCALELSHALRDFASECRNTQPLLLVESKRIRPRLFKTWRVR
jgi:serine/threonine protein kinase